MAGSVLPAHPQAYCCSIPWSGLPQALQHVCCILDGIHATLPHNCITVSINHGFVCTSSCLCYVTRMLLVEAHGTVSLVTLILFNMVVWQHLSCLSHQYESSQVYKGNSRVQIAVVAESQVCYRCTEGGCTVGKRWQSRCSGPLSWRLSQLTCSWSGTCLPACLASLTTYLPNAGMLANSSLQVLQSASPPKWRLCMQL